MTGLASDDIPSKTTVCSRSVRKDEIHPRVELVTPIGSSFLSRCLCATLSNAFEKSNKMAFFSSVFKKSSALSRSCVSH